MAVENKTLGLVFAVILLITRLFGGTLTPLFLDSLNPSATVLFNSSDDQVPILPSSPSWERIDPFICIWISMGFDTVILGTVVGLNWLCRPRAVMKKETSFPRSSLLLSGSAQAVSALLFQFSSSGSRTAPYLFGVLGYFYIPVAFSLRYFILHKRPTRIKLLCVALILLAEFVSLIPTIFPGLENQSNKKEEGGAVGIGRILWPMCFVLSSIPHALWSVLMERSVKTSVINDRSQHNDTSGCSEHPAVTVDCQHCQPPHVDHRIVDDHSNICEESQSTTCPHEEAKEETSDLTTLNMAYVMFWNFFGTFLMTVCLFWLDLIPGFGLLPDIKLFGKQFIFNVKCIFGAEEQCGFHQIFTGWGRMAFKTTSFVVAGLLLRYSEGANFYAILGAIQNPLRFLTFTLFDEQPFRWHPHATLSTWLSIGSLIIMFPAVIIYTKSPEMIENPPDVVIEPDTTICGVTDAETTPLLVGEDLSDVTGVPGQSYVNDVTIRCRGVPRIVDDNVDSIVIQSGYGSINSVH